MTYDPNVYQQTFFHDYAAFLPIPNLDEPSWHIESRPLSIKHRRSVSTSHLSTIPQKCWSIAQRNPIQPSLTFIWWFLRIGNAQNGWFMMIWGYPYSNTHLLYHSFTLTSWTFTRWSSFTYDSLAVPLSSVRVFGEAVSLGQGFIGPEEQATVARMGIWIMKGWSWLISGG